MAVQRVARGIAVIGRKRTAVGETAFVRAFAHSKANPPDYDGPTVVEAGGVKRPRRMLMRPLLMMAALATALPLSSCTSDPYYNNHVAGGVATGAAIAPASA